ncbi:SurA N-terminal domain-containing protein [Stutzerimonas urumqiensis]|uniref:SurA N-terminal domain-containing protein n=1 Tax=Stutzerimonas urumqiensis TaxID=638269 RepID=UPI003DA3245A
MLQNIRDNSQGWIAKTIIGVIIVLLALTGFDAIFNAAANRDSVATVNGEDIATTQLEQAVNLQRRQLLQQLGGDFDPALLNDQLLRESALNSLIERMLLLQATQDMDFAFSDQALDELIVQTPEFQVNGKFDVARFDQVLQQMGYSRLEFRQLLQGEMLIGQLRAGVAGTAFVTDDQIDAFAGLERQTRDFSYHIVPAETDVSVTDDAVAAYYEENKELFKTPEQVVLEYLILDKANFVEQAEVPAEAVQSAYDEYLGGLSEQRRASHILIEVNDDTSDEEAKAQLEAIEQRLAAGEDFSQLAKEISDDPGSAAEGGDLGFAGKGVYDETFEQTLFALEEGKVSEPIRTEFGWHLIKLTGVRGAEAQTFEELEPRLLEELKTAEAERLFIEASRELEGLAFEASDLQQPAEAMNLVVQTSKPFGREGGEGIAANNKVVQAAFAEEVLQGGANSGVIELSPGRVAVVRVKEHLQPQVQELAVVRSEIEARLKAQQAAEAAKARGQELVEQLEAGKPTDIEWQQVEAASRVQEGVDPAILQAVFKMPKPDEGQPEFDGFALGDGSFAVVSLSGVSQPKLELSESDRQEYRRFLSSRAGQQAFAAYREMLRATAEIDRQVE